jgi:hypothetical protein
MMRRYAWYCGFALAAVLAGTPALRADPDKDESGKGSQQRQELRKDIDEANRELRKAEEERDRELDKARAEARKEDKPEKFYEKRHEIWSKFRENESKISGKLNEKYGRAYVTYYDGPRDEYRKFPYDDDRAHERRDEETWLKLPDCPPEVRRIIDRERGPNDVAKILRTRVDGREIFRVLIVEDGNDWAIVVSSGGRLIDEFRRSNARQQR